MCGEHGGPLDDDTINWGSSPHVRGTPAGRRLHRLCGGIIPACAGNTRGWSRVCRPRRDHPRMCGEHSELSPQRSARSGSSPHVRGTRAMQSLMTMALGIIPACAGNTCLHLSQLLGCWDHPRMCGEHRDYYQRGSDQTGSSPHVRGTLRHRLQGHAETGIIPACAGNTRGMPRNLYATRDHPRMCGEH